MSATEIHYPVMGPEAPTFHAMVFLRFESPQSSLHPITFENRRAYQAALKKEVREHLQHYVEETKVLEKINAITGLSLFFSTKWQERPLPSGEMELLPAVVNLLGDINLENLTPAQILEIASLPEVRGIFLPSLLQLPAWVPERLKEIFHLDQPIELIQPVKRG